MRQTPVNRPGARLILAKVGSEGSSCPDLRLADMATWEDGPEYAPAERPSTFDAPAAASLAEAPGRRTPPAAPGAAPAGFTEPENVEPLERYDPEPGPQRDPEEPYCLARSTLTQVDSDGGRSAWGTVHDYHVAPLPAEPSLLPDPHWGPPSGPPVTPVRPLARDPWAPFGPAHPGSPGPSDFGHPTGSHPPLPSPPQPPGRAVGQGRQGPPAQPGAPVGQPHDPVAGARPQEGPVAPIRPSARQPEWLPADDLGPERPARRVRAADVVDGVTLPTILTLLVGGTAMVVPFLFFGWLSPLMFLLAFATSTQIEYQRHWVRNTFLVASGALGTTLVLGLLTSPANVFVFFELVYAMSTVVCWIVLLTLFVIVWHALSSGDEPEPGPPGRPSGGG